MKRPREDEPLVATEGSGTCAGEGPTTTVAAVQPTETTTHDKKKKKKVKGGTAGAATEDPRTRIPEHKVGKGEMYERFAPQYDRLMNYHDCRAIERYLIDDLLSRQLLGLGSSSTPTTDADTSTPSSGTSIERLREYRIGLADFGCGTGRIALMFSPFVRTLLCYDKAKGMLKECKQNLMATAERTHGRRVRFHGALEPRSKPMVEVHFGAKGDGGAPPLPSTEPSHSEAPAATEADLDVLLDQKTFEDMQGGCLRSETLFPQHASKGFHIAVCAWSLSAVMNAQWGSEERWGVPIDATLKEMEDLLRREGTSSETTATCTADGEKSTSKTKKAIVIIETLGTCTEEPTRKNTLHTYLQERHHFEFQWVRTDYVFNSKDEGMKLSKFFFGDAVAKKFAELGPDVVRLAECTGIWTKILPL